MSPSRENGGVWIDLANFDYEFKEKDVIACCQEKFDALNFQMNLLPNKEGERLTLGPVALATAESTENIQNIHTFDDII